MHTERLYLLSLCYFGLWVPVCMCYYMYVHINVLAMCVELGVNSTMHLVHPMKT